MIFFLSLAYYEFKYGEGANMKLVRGACLLSFLFFFGLRGYIGYDYNSYYPLYANINIKDIFSGFTIVENEQVEPGYLLYMSIIRFITSNYHIFTFISVVIDVLLFDLVIKRYSFNYALSFALFLAFNLALEVDLLRNVKSLFIFLLALKYLIERKPWKYFLMLLVAILFHWTAILFAPLYFFLHKPLPRIAVIWIIVIGNFVFFSHTISVLSLISNLMNHMGGVFEYKQNLYFDNSTFNTSWGFSLGYFERLATTIVILIFYDRLIEQNKNNILFINLFIIYIVLFLYFADMQILVLRLALLFSVAYWILIPAIPYLFKSPRNAWVFIIIVMLYSLVKIVETSDNILYRYDNVIFGIENFNDRSITFDQNNPTS
jgi:hypothetical protein